MGITGRQDVEYNRFGAQKPRDVTEARYPGREVDSVRRSGRVHIDRRG